MWYIRNIYSRLSTISEALALDILENHEECVSLLVDDESYMET